MGSPPETHRDCPEQSLESHPVVIPRSWAQLPTRRGNLPHPLFLAALNTGWGWEESGALAIFNQIQFSVCEGTSLGCPQTQAVCDAAQGLPCSLRTCLFTQFSKLYPQQPSPAQSPFPGCVYAGPWGKGSQASHPVLRPLDSGFFLPTLMASVYS